MVKALTKLNEAIGSAGNWLTVIAFLVGAYAWLSRRSAFLSPLNWADRLFLSIGAALITALIASTCLACVRYFRPLPVRAVPLPAHLASSPVDAFDIANVTARLDGTFAAVGQLRQRLDGLEQPLKDAIRAGKVFKARERYRKALRLAQYVDTLTNPVLPDSVLLIDGFFQRPLFKLAQDAEIDASYIAEAAKAAELEIKGNAIFCVLVDRDPWSKPESKQAWHVRRRFIEVIKKKTDEVVYDVAREAEVADFRLDEPKSFL